jgi:membrane-bound lytic murein transglycosylase D
MNSLTPIKLNDISLKFREKMRKTRSILKIALSISIVFLWSCSSLKTPNPIETQPQAPAENQIPQQAEPKEQAPPVEKAEAEQSAGDISKENEPQKNKKDPQLILEEALSTYQDCQPSWEKGDFDSALAALDEAYRLILSLDLAPDSALIQEKNDLRLLIAQRIQEIYASRLRTVGNNHRTIPIVENQSVQAEIKKFQNEERELFLKWYQLSGRYRPMILEELRKAGLPEELSWMPLIESGFNVRAYSRARALGLWQFIASTGTRYGLKIDRWIDERMDPIKSTRAAINYLTELHSYFGDWTTALASYNCGEFKVQRVINSQHVNYLDNFWDLYRMLPYETARFVPRFMASILIINNPEKYGFNLSECDPASEFEEISVNYPVRLSSLAKELGIEEQELISLNPELRQNSTPDAEYILRVPQGLAEKASNAFNSLPRWMPPEETYIIYYVQRGDTLSEIAKRYRTSVSAIARLNGLNHVHLINRGQRLKIPARGRASLPAPPMDLAKEGDNLVYIVKPGDSLYQIASTFGTTAEKIKEANNLKEDVLNSGQRLVIRSGKPEGAIIYSVESGDSPFSIAKKFGMQLSALLNLNGLGQRSKIFPGQELWVIPKK